jgi:hypothetical protein
VRLCIDLMLRGTVHSASDLAAELARRSGLNRLRQVLVRQFADRSQVLKARSALAAVRVVAASGGCHDPDALLAAAEQITSGAHAFEEVRFLDLLRSGELELPADFAAELDRLLGGSGHDPASRLGLSDGVGGPGDDDTDAEPGSGPEVVTRDAALEALSRWRSVAENPLAGRGLQNAARVAIRSIEGVMMQFQSPSP